MNTPNNYRQVYKNLGTTARTEAEAYRNADYATPIWRCESDTDRAITFFKEASLGFALIAVVVGGCLSIFYFLVG